MEKIFLKKKNLKNDEKSIIVENDKNEKVNKNSLENSILKYNSKEEINKDELKKKTPKLDSGFKEVSSFSLASVEQKRTFKKRKTSGDFSKSKNIGNESYFTQEDLERCWNTYYDKKIQNKEFNIPSLLKISRPKKNNNEVKYTVISDINKKELENELPKLMEYIRKSLKNDFIEVKIDSNKSIKKNILFTPTEKFEKLVEINPSLEILRKKLDLDY